MTTQLSSEGQVRPASPDSSNVSRLVGMGALLLGAVGLAIGIGIGVRWLRAGAISWMSVVSLVALVVGLGLVTLGVSRVTRGLRAGARIAVAFLVVVVVAALVWILTPALIATNVPPLLVGSPAPSDFGLQPQEVHFLAADGSQLWAWYIEPVDGAVVVLRHGAGSTAEDVLPHAAVLVSNGYGVFITDARGHGRSGGSAMDFGWDGPVDIEASLTFLSRQPGVNPGRIAVVGMSMGGEEAIGAAGVDDRIAAVVAEGATARTEADKTWLIDEYGWRGRFQIGLEWLQYSLADLLTDADKPPSLASAADAASPRPILMITAGEVPGERQAAEHIQSEAGGNVAIWTVSGAGHIGGLQTAPREWEQQVIAFLDSVLRAET